MTDDPILSAPWGELDVAHRGAAKSTLATFVDLVHAVAYGLDRFIAIASATDDLSAVFVKSLHRAFTGSVRARVTSPNRWRRCCPLLPANCPGSVVGCRRR